jgi:hypothetical protein
MKKSKLRAKWEKEKARADNAEKRVKELESVLNGVELQQGIVLASLLPMARMVEISNMRILASLEKSMVAIPSPEATPAGVDANRVEPVPGVFGATYPATQGGK